MLSCEVEEELSMGECLVQQEPSDSLLKAWPEALIDFTTDAQPFLLAGLSSAALHGRHLTPHAPTSGLAPPALFWSPQSRRDHSAWTRRTVRAPLDSSVGRNTPGLAAIVYETTANSFAPGTGVGSTLVTVTSVNHWTLTTTSCRSEASSASGANLGKKSSLGSSSNSF
jgi:hypothetical protein